MPEVKNLEWTESYFSRHDTSPAFWTALTGFGSYKVEYYFGSDSPGFELSFEDTVISDFDDPDMAKKFAQHHFAERVLAALLPPLEFVEEAGPVPDHVWNRAASGPGHPDVKEP